MNLPILYEDEYVVVVNKPAGLVVHSDGKTKEPSLADWVLENYPKTKEIGEPLTLASGEIIYRPGIVHRLDRDTSGTIIVAKDQNSFLDLKRQFQNREVKKTYNAYIYGEMNEEDGIVDRPIARSRKDFRLWSAQRGSRGETREAITEYKVLRRTDVGNINNGFTYVEIRPKTGRTHQIRVHFKAINHPIICDTLYAPKRPASLGFERLALHSRILEFTGHDNKLIKVEAPLPEDFVRAEKEFAKY